MAIQASYEFEVNHLKHVIENAYIRIIKAIAEVDDVEIFENIPDNPDGIEQVLRYDKRLTARAIAYVYADKSARENHAYPLHSFTFEFKLDLLSTENIFEQAYRKLYSMENKFIGNTIVNV